MNAEMLAALTILQLHRPGAPVVYAAHPMALDMKTGMASISVGEVGLMSAACIEIGRYYGLPTGSERHLHRRLHAGSDGHLGEVGERLFPAMAGPM